MKEEIYKQVYKLLMEETDPLSRSEYKDLLHETIEACREMLDAMDWEDDLDE